jgi:short subunit dehydrogenase-like uncharacterized protein
MSHTILLYGATGYSGRLIAAEGQRTGMDNRGGVPGYRMVLAGRHERALAQLADRHGMEHRVFGLEDRQDLVRGLTDVDVVINAAGPFALTAKPLAVGALVAGCHYVDINGEVNVYKQLDDLGRHAAHRNLTMVCGAGHTAAASDLLLHTALADLRRDPQRLDDDGAAPIELGAVRIALSRIMTLSRGSTDTVLRSLREQVTVVRLGDVEDDCGNMRKAQVLWHEPVGRLERTFDFRDHQHTGGSRTAGSSTSPSRIASAANLVDTLTARLTVARHQFAAQRIESYVEAGAIARLGYQLGTLVAPLVAMPWVRDLARIPIDALPAGPTAPERASEPHTVVLDIEDPFYRTVLNWAWHTPNPYDFTAQVAIEVAKRVAVMSLIGWSTPSEVLHPDTADLTATAGYLRGCHLDRRRPLMPARESA